MLSTRSIETKLADPITYDGFDGYFKIRGSLLRCCQVINWWTRIDLPRPPVCAVCEYPPRSFNRCDKGEHRFVRNSNDVWLISRFCLVSSTGSISVHLLVHG
ncbi:hypothetical protein CYMTET_47840 [Cymbomonas tetramitiformis]|uniref:Uncharacterized protein n=1 Tax=Cymbomonas tetramitiformis TaxID=36881 RepID=A0AAE0EPD7_9CHLO|nr:hypothetical protein CYMTET_54631 [Cymbomonas tetramitiformis]KAK3242475.1 hypothetical protein CYMTET_47840 [Cymbomonas tetramitiformis]